MKRSLLLVLFGALIVKLIEFSKGRIFHDEGIYLGIAQYFASAGQIGFFESFRPLLLPTVLIPFTFFSDPLIVARVFSLTFFLLSIAAVYYVAKKWYGEKAAFWSALVFSFSSTVLTYGGYILTDVSAYVLVLISLWLFKEQKYFSSGLLIGLAFLTRFSTAAILPLFAILLLRRKRLKNAFLFSAGSLLSVLPYFIFNYSYHGKLIQPLINALTVVQGIPYEGILALKYAEFLLTKELVLVAAALFFFRKKEYLLPSAIAVYFLFFSFVVKIYDPRYMIALLPFFAIMAGKSFSELSKSLSKKGNFIFIILIMIFGIAGVLVIVEKEDFSSTVDISTIDEGFMTNDARLLALTKQKAEIYTGSNLNYAYMDFAVDQELHYFAINEKTLPCNCPEQLAYLKNNHEIISEGAFQGDELTIITKPAKQGNATTFVRLWNVTITEGYLSDEVILAIEQFEAANITTYLLFNPPDMPNDITLDYLRNRTKVQLGIRGYANHSFNSIVMPIDDTYEEVPKYTMLLVGGWSRTEHYHKKVDLYLVQDWETETLLSQEAFNQRWKALRSSDFEVGVDIPAQYLNKTFLN